MKKVYFPILTLAILVFTACSNENTQDSALGKKKDQLEKAKASLDSMQAIVSSLETEVIALDTSIKRTPVEVMELKPTDFDHYVEIHGVVEASKNILATPEASGRITSIDIKEGQKVSKGQKIATIDASILLKNIEEVRKSLEFVTTVYNKQKALNDKGVGTEMQFLEAKNQKESLEKKLSTLNIQLTKYTVVAPISGFIDDIMPKVGEMASPQMPIVRIVNLDKVFVSADVSEALLGKVKEGDDVDVTFPSLNKTVKGKIVQTGNFINENNRTFKLRIDLAEQSNMFKPNLLTVVRLNDYSAKDAIVIPASTVQEGVEGEAFVFVKKGTSASKIQIEKGETYMGDLEVVSGLEAGTQLITRGFKSLADGEEVKITEY